MKKFKVTFWRGNPQLKNGGYEMTEIFRAKTEAGARRQARKWENDCLYGSVTVQTIEEVKEA